MADMLKLVPAVPCKIHDASTQTYRIFVAARAVCLCCISDVDWSYQQQFGVLKQRLPTLCHILLCVSLISSQTHAQLAPKVLGRHVFVNWPSLHEAKVCDRALY